MDGFDPTNELRNDKTVYRKAVETETDLDALDRKIAVAEGVYKNQHPLRDWTQAKQYRDLQRARARLVSETEQRKEIEDAADDSESDG